jgi:hypothetical protein
MLAEEQVSLSNLFGFVISERNDIYAEFLSRTPFFTQYADQFICETLDLIRILLYALKLS